jgi:hypothetical protein
MSDPDLQPASGNAAKSPDNLQEQTNAPLRLPPQTATPSQVREYLEESIKRRGLPADYAKEVASKWTIGSGAELRSYPMAMYRNIFGAGEEGWMVMATVTSQQYRELAEHSMSLSTKSEHKTYHLKPLGLTFEERVPHTSGSFAGRRSDRSRNDQGRRWLMGAGRMGDRPRRRVLDTRLLDQYR